MLRNATKFSRYRQLELQILRKPSGHLNILKRHGSTVGQTKTMGIGGPFGFAATVALVTGATLSYAKYDPEFREWLDKKVPLANDAVTILFEEDKTYEERLSNIMEDIQNWFNSFFSEEDNSKRKPLPRIVQEEVIPYTAPRSAFATLLEEDSQTQSPDPCAPPEKPWQEIRVASSYDDIKTIVDKPKKIKDDPQDKTVTPQKLIDLEDEIAKNAGIAVESYNKAINAIRDQTRYIQVLMTSDFAKLPSDIWPTIKEKAKIREELINLAQKSADRADENMMQLEKLLAKGELQVSKSVMEQVQRNMKRMKNDIKVACEKVVAELVNTNALKDCKSRIAEARNHWREELAVLFPDVDLGENNLNILSDEIGQFVLYSYINVQYYQKELAKLEMRSDKRLQEAMEKASKTGDSKELVAAAVEEELRAERRKLDIDYQRKSMELRASCEQEVRKQLRLQAEIQADHLRDSIELRKVELARSHRRELNSILNEENIRYQLELASLVGRMKGLDEGLRAHAQIDKSAHQAQDLWTACQIFYRNIDSSSAKCRPLESEVSAIQKIAPQSDSLIKLVIKGLPSEVVSRGVYPLRVLRERFLKVEKVARNIAEVPADGSSLPMYFLSWIQGGLIWKGSQPISDAELQDQPTAHHLLNNYDLLSRARYFMDRGDLAQALRYMNLLQGASKAIAWDWMNEARIYLECQQAATVLVTHAAAKGLMYT